MPTCHNCNHPKKETSYCWKACKLSETPPGQPYQGALVSIDAVHDANPLANMDAETDMPCRRFAQHPLCPPQGAVVCQDWTPPQTHTRSHVGPLEGYLRTHRRV
jgi:hypothetical protein